MNGGVGIVAPAAVPGFGYGILPPGRRRLSASCCMLSLSKSARSVTSVIPSFCQLKIGGMWDAHLCFMFEEGSDLGLCQYHCRLMGH